MRRALILLALFPLAACVSAPPPPPREFGKIPDNKVWARKDGQMMSTNPALLAQGKTDLATCQRDAGTDQPGVLDLTTFKGCMDGKGYYLIDRQT
ncbi:hypothetical protein WDZ92_42525 [Nostoc sp. NIES-2111]